VAQALGVPAEHVLGLPHDSAAAAGLAGTWSRHLDRSPLVNAARHLAATLHEYLTASAPGALPSSPRAERVNVS
jgi:hypothetical protein